MSSLARRARTAGRYLIAILAGVVWTWAAALLSTRHHLVGKYDVIPGAPPLWGFVALPGLVLVIVLGAGACITALWLAAVRTTGRVRPRPVTWLSAAALIPALDLARLAGVDVPMSFLEPLLLVAMTGAAAGQLAELLGVPPKLRKRLDAVPWPAMVGLVAFAAGAWWYHQGVRGYDGFMLGFNDFGHFGWRVANTWEGRGFLMETPSLPPFWDHFNPGLALLAPLWGLWPDARLFMLMQAICLALPAPIVYAIGRRLGAAPLEAAMWAAAYLMFPPVGQLNLNYSYGWHPVSLALPLLLASVLALLRGWRTAALVAALLACTFGEEVLVVLSCLAAAMALAGWLNRRRRAPPAHESAVLADRLPTWAWIAAAAVLACAFVAIFKLAGFSRYQVSRFAALGDSFTEVLLSPILRPGVFWGTVLQIRSAYFLLALLLPLGLRSLGRGWPMLMACALPVGVLLAWDHAPAKSIAFQYTTTLIPVLFLAAMAGASRGRRASAAGGKKSRPQERPSPAGSAEQCLPMWRGGVTALAACASASLWMGALPWSSPTLTDVLAQTYLQAGDPQVVGDRAVGSAGNAALNAAVARVSRKHASVLATGRIASHLLGVQRLDTVGQARARWAAFAAEVGEGHSAIELFDWIVLDTNERFQQSEADLQFVLDEARRANYRIVSSSHGIVVLARPYD